MAGCAKDGSEGPPPKTPPPPPPHVEGDFREIIEQVVREVTGGSLMVRVRPGAGFFGLNRSPVEMVPVGAAPTRRGAGKRAFMVTYQDRGAVDDQRVPDLVLEHAQHLRRLSDEGTVDSAAVYASGAKGMVILLTETKAEAERLAAIDPLLVGGYYGGFELEELVPSFVGDC